MTDGNNFAYDVLISYSSSDQAWTLNTLAYSYSLSGQPRRAVPLFEASNAIDEKRGDQTGVAIGLGNLASMAQIYIGALRAAEANLRRQVELCREIGDEILEAVGHVEMGRLLAYRGAWYEAESVHQEGIILARKRGNQQMECVITAYSAQGALLMRNASLALTHAERARELADIPFPGIGRPRRDVLRADWLLGAAYRADGDPNAADRHLTEALIRCRSINAVEFEADILLDLARLRRDQAQTGGSFGPEPQDDRVAEALRLAQEALTITERSGYVLQGADVRLFLAQLSLDAGDRAAALEHARQACQLATGDGPPDYTYKVVYEEAGALLASLEHEGAK